MVTTESVRMAVLDAAKEVFESMVFTSLEASEAPAAPGNEAFLASITFKGGLEGCLSLHCDPPCAQRIAAGMLCTQETLAEIEVIDALGEIANLVMGGVKTRLMHEIRDLQISIPSVIQGRQLRPHTTDGTTRLTVPVIIAPRFPAEFSLLYRLHNSC
jgi:CheY-specific phosphatase CheX